MTAYRLIPALALGALLATQADATDKPVKPTKPQPVFNNPLPVPATPIPRPAAPVTIIETVVVPSPELDALRRTSRDYIAATGAMASIQTRTPTEGQWTGAIGLSGTDYGADGLAGAVRYGISDSADIYGVVGHSRYGGTVWGIGATWVIGGGK